MNAIYTILFGNTYREIGKMLIKSIRNSHFKGDIITITETDQFEDTNCINANQFPNEFRYAKKLFHKKNDTDLDYLLIRLQPHKLFNTNKYERILYLDSDCLVFNDPDIILNQLKDDIFYASADFKNLMKRHTGKLRHLFTDDGMKIRAMNSGVFGFRVNEQNLQLMDLWAHNYLLYRDIEPRLQPSLNLTYVKNRDKFDYLPYTGFKDKKDQDIIVHFIPWKIFTTIRKMKEHINNKSSRMIDKITFLVTTKCNLRCQQCSQKALKRTYDYQLNITDFKRVLDEIAINNITINQLHISGGGEPTLWDHLEEALILIKNYKNINKVIVFTNGCNINRLKGFNVTTCISNYGFNMPKDLSDLKRVRIFNMREFSTIPTEITHSQKKIRCICKGIAHFNKYYICPNAPDLLIRFPNIVNITDVSSDSIIDILNKPRHTKLCYGCHSNKRLSCSKIINTQG